MSTDPLTQSSQVQTTQVPTGLRALLDRPEYKNRLAEILKQRAPQFAAALIQLVNQSEKLQKCDPHSVIAAAMTAAVLDLPIDKNLGFAHIVPYGNVAQFQMGYKGLIQLALRTGQYHRMNAKAVNEEAFKGYDEVGDPIIDWSELDETKEAVGYAFAWQMISGFTKVVYWTRKKVLNHAQKFSQAYKNKKMDSPWFTNEPAMALKTVVKDGLSHWGIMSVEMQRAIVMDQTVQRSIDSDPEYIDTTAEVSKAPERTVETTKPMDAKAPAAQASATSAPQAGKRRRSMKEASAQPPAQQTPPPAQPPAQQQPPKTEAQTEAQMGLAPAAEAGNEQAADAEEKEWNELIDKLADLSRVADIHESQIVEYCKVNLLCNKKAEEVDDMNTATLRKLVENWSFIKDTIKSMPVKQ